MKVIQELVAHFERKKKLAAEEIKAQLDQGLLASDAPARIQDLCDTPGTTYYFRGPAPPTEASGARMCTRPTRCWLLPPFTPVR